MKYNRVFIESIGYELGPVVVSSTELEQRLDPMYRKLHIPRGQLESITGIIERRWWEKDYPLSEGAKQAGLRAIRNTNVTAEDLEVLIYAGVCREQFEPATACRVAHGLGISPQASVYDVSNACLGVLNGIIDIANRIELGQIKAGMVVSCESAREINEIMIDNMLNNPTMDVFKNSIATLTGGSGAVAVLLTDGSFSTSQSRRLVGGVTQSAPEHYSLCRWGIDNFLPTLVTHFVSNELPSMFTQFMSTDSVSVLKHGLDLGIRTWRSFQHRLGWAKDQIDKVICHQVGAGHRDSILNAFGIPLIKDFSTFPYLGNIGTVSLPLTAALAEERGFLIPGDRVGFLGIGSGLNCMMLGWEW